MPLVKTNESEETQMTLYELVNDTTVQGNIRISTWNGDEEEVLLSVSNEDDLCTGDLDEAWEDREVKYIFYPGDGFLHIEVESTD